MLRPVLSYVLTAVILLSQVGLPLHAHYCQGTLESISVLFSAGCNDHEAATDEKSCCQPAASGCCHTQPADCCDDETMVLLQDVDSVAPHIEKWDASFGNVSLSSFNTEITSITPTEVKHTHATNDSGPPIYIRCHSLIYYA